MTQGLKTKMAVHHGANARKVVNALGVCRREDIPT